MIFAMVVPQSTRVNYLECYHWPALSPAVNQFPPQKFHPFVDRRFRPFPMSPPLHAKVTWIKRSGNTEVVSRYFMSKNIQRPARMEVRRYQQNIFTAGLL